MEIIKENFIYLDKKIEMNFDKNDLLKDVLASFALKIEKNIEEFNFLYNNENIPINSIKKLSDYNNKEESLNITVYPEKEFKQKTNNIISPNNLKFHESKLIICPKCKNMSEINIKDFKISLKNCINNHTMSDLFMNDFINTQYVDESNIKCKFCNKTEYDLNKEENNKLLLCSCGIIICKGCFGNHKGNNNEKDNKNHNFIEYNNKDYFCIEHNSSFTGYCLRCKKNICAKCEKDKHSKHRIDFYNKISPKEVFIQKIKSMNENLITKITKFNKKLKELTDLVNNISNNIQNNLKILLKITNNVIDNFNFKRKNYQTITNIKNIYNTINETPILEKIDEFLKNKNYTIGVEIILDIYDKMYSETNKNFCSIKKHPNKNNIGLVDKKKEEIKKEKSSNDNKVNNGNNKNLSDSFMIMKYKPNLKKIKNNNIKIFGNKFVENNKDKCSLIINGSEYPLSEFYTLKKNDIKNNELEIRLNQNKTINDMSFMFHSDLSESEIYLTSITNISNWNISFVTDISNLFCNCSLLASLPDISYWDTNNITNISNLFYHCTSLTLIPDISKWTIKNVTNMSYLFYDCKSLTSLPNISSWDTSKVIDMRGIFSNCSSLIQLPDISKWNTKNVNNMSGLFHHCTKLAKLPEISEWNTENVINMNGMFDHCTSLKALPDISKWDTRNVNNLNYMFYYCSELSSLPDISKWNTDNVKSMKGLFCDCNSLSILPDISKWNTSNVINMSCMFYNCTSLLSLPDLMEWNVSKVEDKKSMFTNCDKLPQQIIPRKFKI